MSTDFEATLSEVGYAKVIVELNDVKPASVNAAATPLDAHFVIPDDIQAERLSFVAARAASTTPARPRSVARVRVYENLGLAVGYVDRAGAAALASHSQVRRVVPAPEISLVRPVTVAAAATTQSWGL